MGEGGPGPAGEGEREREHGGRAGGSLCEGVIEWKCVAVLECARAGAGGGGGLCVCIECESVSVPARLCVHVRVTWRGCGSERVCVRSSRCL